jgi:hypothetical protein
MPRKVIFTGAARGYFFGDKLEQQTSEIDTTTIPRLNSGHVMADLGTHIRPNAQMEIIGMVRVRNDYGGFWGSGVTFDVRQLSVRGVIGGVLRYQLGDIDYRMSKLTLWNNDQELYSNMPTAFKQQMDVINYDHFYGTDNAWRQQGGSAEWGLVFKKWVQELQVQLVTTRNYASNFGNLSDRLFSGLSAQLVQSKYVALGFNYVDLYDVSGTSRNSELFHNPVWTSTLALSYNKQDWSAQANMEWGKSQTEIRNSAVAPVIEGNALEADVVVSNTKLGLKMHATVRNISSGFLSPGAQTKRIDFAGRPEAYERVGNDQHIRDYSVMDIMRESTFYTMQIQPYLMAFDPKYDNITPYGSATPNRQGMIVGAEWTNTTKTIQASAEQVMLQESRGEGTLKAREFSRTALEVRFENDKKISPTRTWAVEATMRMDKTEREGTELYRGVDLATNSIGLGAEFELFKKLDVLAGWQLIEYSGFDFVAQRDQYAQIINFTEYNVNGRESITAAGLRYRFSENSFLTTQVNLFDVNDGVTAERDYTLRQVMVLYSIKF